MAIKRLHIPEGAPIWGPTKPHTLAIKLWRERQGDISVLEPGNYDVTPEPSRLRFPNSNLLTVLEDSTAIYRIFSIGQAAISKLNSRESGSVDNLPDGRGVLTHLPQDTPARLVVADRPERNNRGVLFLFDVIVWSEPDGSAGNEIDISQALDPRFNLVTTNS